MTQCRSRESFLPRTKTPPASGILHSLFHYRLAGFSLGPGRCEELRPWNNLGARAAPRKTRASGASSGLGRVLILSPAADEGLARPTCSRGGACTDTTEARGPRRRGRQASRVRPTLRLPPPVPQRAPRRPTARSGAHRHPASPPLCLRHFQLRAAGAAG